MENTNIDTADFSNCIEQFGKLYDIVRVVDPLSKSIVRRFDSTSEPLDMSCYDFWEKGTFCDNCVSMRVINEHDTFIKLEYHGGRIYMVLSGPFTYQDQSYVLELIKDVTDSDILPELPEKSPEAIAQMIRDMHNVIIRDSLTDLFNHRCISERLPVDIYRSNNSGRPLSVIMADIDHFKRINDTYGHLAGDEVLRDFALCITQSVRRRFDWVARYGGDEFFIALTDANQQTAREVAEKIRIRIENHEFIFQDTPVYITASFGSYTLKSKTVTAKDLIGLADQNLYKAKNSGRNCIVCK